MIELVALFVFLGLVLVLALTLHKSEEVTADDDPFDPFVEGTPTDESGGLR